MKPAKVNLTIPLWPEEEATRQVLLSKEQKAGKNTPPARFWEAPDYAPSIGHIVLPEPVTDYLDGEEWIFDVESYPNFFEVLFLQIRTGRIFIADNDDVFNGDADWIFNSGTVISFNGIKYDIPILSIARAGATTEELFGHTQRLIYGEKYWTYLKQLKITPIECDHIDLIELAPLDASLKVYAGRLHCHTMQDLPYKPNTVLTEMQKGYVRKYCYNDAVNTLLLCNELRPRIDLRKALSKRYGMDLRSKSNAQMAEAVIKNAIERDLRCKVYAPKPHAHTFRYEPPSFLRFHDPNLRSVLETYQNLTFEVNEAGLIDPPQELNNFVVQYRDGSYKVGIGGIHSRESGVAHYRPSDGVLFDADVGSYYPKMIVNYGLGPAPIRAAFLRTYERFRQERLAAKHNGDKVISEGLKIFLNGVSGKFKQPYSIFWSPESYIKMTVTGQLSLLMLVEQLGEKGIDVLSVNTDGIMVMTHGKRVQVAYDTIKQFEQLASLEMEFTQYSAVYQRDVNNYFALKLNGGDRNSAWLDERLGIKVKGVYAERGSTENSILSKNPSNLVCNDAVMQKLVHDIETDESIYSCRDLRRFVKVRKVKGGALCGDEFLGKVVRSYYSTKPKGNLIYAESGNKVPMSERVTPVMTMPDEFPDDVDFSRYASEADQILIDIGYYS